MGTLTITRVNGDPSEPRRGLAQGYNIRCAVLFYFDKTVPQGATDVIMELCYIENIFNSVKEEIL